MAGPSSALDTLRPDLAGSVEEFDLIRDREGFIGTKVLPVFEVAEAGGSFGVIPVEQLLRDKETARAPGGGYNRDDFTFQPTTYTTVEHGSESPVDDNQARMYRNYLDVEETARNRAVDALLRGGERRAAAKVFDTSRWTGSPLASAVVAAWSDPVNGKPVTDVNAARLKFWNGGGMWPNAIVFNRQNFLYLRETAQVIDRVASQGAGSSVKAADITIAQIAACFDLKYVIVAGSARNTANPGQAAAFSQIWSNSYAMLCRVAETKDIQEPCIGRTFLWFEEGGAEGMGPEVPHVVESYRDPKVRGDVIRVRHQCGEQILYTQMGHLLTGVSA